MPPWHFVAQAALVSQAEGPRRVLLQQLVDEGDGALVLLADATGVSKRAMLVRVFGEDVVAANAVAWRLP